MELFSETFRDLVILGGADIELSLLGKSWQLLQSLGMWRRKKKKQRYGVFHTLRTQLVFRFTHVGHLPWGYLPLAHVLENQARPEKGCMVVCAADLDNSKFRSWKLRKNVPLTTLGSHHWVMPLLKATEIVAVHQSRGHVLLKALTMYMHRASDLYI